MFTLHTMKGESGAETSLRCGDPHQGLFGFLEATPVTRYYAECVDEQTGVLVQGDIYEEPYLALAFAAWAMWEEAYGPSFVEYE